MVLDCTGHLVMESIVETKAAPILQFVHGLRGSGQVALEEGTCAVWLGMSREMPPLRGNWPEGGHIPIARVISMGRRNT